MASMVRAVLTLWISVLQSAAALFRSRRDQAIVEMVRRQQLAIYARRHRRPRCCPWIEPSRSACRSSGLALVVAQPKTVVRWHQPRSPAYWRSISTPGPGLA
jgi:hypothetical protein